jgi:site-specific DNA recombinase
LGKDPDMEKIVLYSRVSTDLQEFQSQFEDLRRWAASNQFEVVASFGEKVSGFDLSAERAEYEKMKEYVLAHKITQIAVWEISRLSRSTGKALTEIEFFTQHGINIFFKKEGLNSLSDNATNKMLLTILSSVAELERNTILERSIRGKITAAHKGKRIGFAIMPYGFKDVDGYIQIEPDEAQIIHMIYERAAKGETVRGIATYLNSLGIQTRRTLQGKKRKLKTGQEVGYIWRNNTIRKILRAQIYKGIRPYRNNFLIPIPQIIDEQLWDKVQTRFKDHIGNATRTKYDYLFKGKIYCGRCKGLYGARTELRYAHKPSFYFCHGAKDKGIKCQNGQFATPIFDKRIWDIILLYGSGLNQKIKDQAMEQNNFAAKQDQIIYFEKELQKLETKKDRINLMFREGYISEEDYKRDQSEIKFLQAEANNEILKLRRELEFLKDLSSEDLRTRFIQLTTEESFEIKRAFIQNYVDKIIIHKIDECRIKFKGLEAIELNGQKIKKYTMKEPGVQEKLIYVEMFTYGLQDPLKAVISNRKIALVSNQLKMENRILFNLIP